MAKVYGYSDDVVVIENIEGGCTEIDCYNKDVTIEFEDGTVIHIGYGKDNKAIWGLKLPPVAVQAMKKPSVMMKMRRFTAIFWKLKLKQFRGKSWRTDNA